MSFADAIINGQCPPLEPYLKAGNSIEDIDEYGFTPLIECAIVSNNTCAKYLLDNGAKVDTPDTTGRTALHWAVDHENSELAKLLLEHKADPNAFNRGGQSVLVYPILRQQWELKQLLYGYGANLHFAKDFINSKLIGHRFALKGDIDILNAKKEFIELDFEGFFLEITLAIIHDSLNRFRNNFAARHLRQYFPGLEIIIDGFDNAGRLLKFQTQAVERARHDQKINALLNQPLMILPIAYEGHAITMLKAGNIWAKVDRGENSRREGSVNIYYIENPENAHNDLYKSLLYKKQTKRFIHHQLNEVLGLRPLIQLPISQQISGNCSWANIEATVPTAFMLYLLANNLDIDTAQLQDYIDNVMYFYKEWHEWDKDRALHDAIQSFYAAENTARLASKVSMLANVLFQSCDYTNPLDLARAEKIIPIITLPAYRYVLDSYLEVYVAKKLSKRGNNLLHLLEDFGIDTKTGVHPFPARRK